MPQTLSKPQSRQTAHALRQDEIMMRRQEVQRLWLLGLRPVEIALQLDISLPMIHQDVRQVRRQLYEDNKATLQEHAEQSVAIFRQLEAKLWYEYESGTDPRERAVILTHIRRTEESVAKVRGVLSNRSIVDVVQHVKLYDFENKFPQAAAAVIEGEVKALSEAQIPFSQSPVQASEDYPEYKQPVYETGENVIELPNGDLVDLDTIEFSKLYYDDENGSENNASREED